MTGDQRAQRSSIAALMTQTPYLAWLAVGFDRFDPDDVILRLPFREELTNDGSAYHGGVIAAALDTAGAGAAWSNHDIAAGTRASTISMGVQYVGTARHSDLVCHARTVRRAKELIFTDITASDDAGRIVAHALQTYRIV